MGHCDDAFLAASVAARETAAANASTDVARYSGSLPGANLMEQPMDGACTAGAASWREEGGGEFRKRTCTA